MYVSKHCSQIKSLFCAVDLKGYETKMIKFDQLMRNFQALESGYFSRTTNGLASAMRYFTTCYQQTARVYPFRAGMRDIKKMREMEEKTITPKSTSTTSTESPSPEQMDICPSVEECSQAKSSTGSFLQFDDEGGSKEGSPEF